MLWAPQRAIPTCQRLGVGEGAAPAAVAVAGPRWWASQPTLARMSGGKGVGHTGLLLGWLRCYGPKAKCQEKEKEKRFLLFKVVS